MDFLAGQRLTAFLVDPLGGNSAVRQDGPGISMMVGEGHLSQPYSGTIGISDLFCGASVSKFDCGGLDAIGSELVI